MRSRRRYSTLLCCVSWLLSPVAAWSQIATSTPVSTPSVDTSIPPLVNATGPLIEAPVEVTDQQSVHEGRFTWGPDLVDPGTSLRSVWTGVQFTVPNHALAFTAAPSFPFHVNHALFEADAKLLELDAGGVGSLFTSFT